MAKSLGDKTKLPKLPPMVLGVCDCNSEFQDRTYGIKVRQHTTGRSTTKPPYRCTVCGNGKDRVVMP